jgi:asparagine synthase (glutamine-hydrolysing)
VCGIIGTFSSSPSLDIDRDAVRRGMECMRLRGPDEEGYFEAPGIALGHRRLSIIDLKAGQQPFIDQKTGVTLVFNGEIFNFNELRAELESKGHGFKSHSDTEVLLRAYLEWGEDCLSRLSGMYAMAFYDPRTQSMMLARDRVGVKPLFYAQRGDHFFFASSMKALLAFSAIEPVMDLPAVSHYLTTIRTSLGRRSMIRDVSVLLPGESLRLRRGDWTPMLRRYWDFPVVPPSEKKDVNPLEAVRRVQELMTHSVREQLVSDVPLGGFLSGGLDSSILAGLAQRLTNGRYNAYSVGYDVEGYHEWPYVRRAVDRYKMWCKDIHLQPETYPSDWKYLVAEKGLPLSTPNEVPIYHLARALRQDFTVALSGEGADEIFGGYVLPYFSAYDYDRARHVEPPPDEVLNSTDRAIRRLYRRPWLADHVDQHFLLNSWIASDLKRSMLQEDCWNELQNDEGVLSFYGDLFSRFKACSTFDQHMHVHARINLEGLLFRVDSSTMAASVEARVPYTDHRLVEFLFHLPDRYKIDWASPRAAQEAERLNVAEIDRKNLVESKILLRRAFAQDVDESILKRKKMSFPVPVREWMGGFLRDTAREVIEASTLKNELFNRASLNRILETADLPLSGIALWPVTNLCLWQIEMGIRI